MIFFMDTAFKIVTALSLFVTNYLAFYKLYTPKQEKRKWVLLAAIGINTLIGTFVLNNINSSIIFYAGYAAIWLVVAAFLCGHGRMAFYTAVYCFGIFMLFNACAASFYTAITGKADTSNSGVFYPVQMTASICRVAWAYFYYIIMRKYTDLNGKSQRRSFWIIATVLPFGSIGLILLYGFYLVPFIPLAGNDASKLFIPDAAMSIFLLIINCMVFYLYARQSVVYNAQVFANITAKTLPLWTVETGLSPAFIQKYKIRPAEQRVVELMMLGKSNKEIAVILNKNIRTPEKHLQNVYVRTGAAGRVALMALIHSN
jgi:DNA-binding CsgD family transcriptional regulator